jgi:predicted N-acetyltransferase YhbS
MSPGFGRASTSQQHEATVAHLRAGGGEREVDLIVVRGDDRVVGIELKLARTIGDNDVRHLRWLREQIGRA